MKAMIETATRTSLGPRIQFVRREIDLGDSESGFPDLQEITTVAAEAFEEEMSDDHFYVNPECSIRASSVIPEMELLIEADRACGRWMQRLRKMFGRGRLDRMLQSLRPNKRMLVESGVLYLNGSAAHTKRLNWRATSQQAPR